MNKLIHDGIWIGSTAGILSGLALLIFGARENGSAFAPTNAVSHWLWRGRAFWKDDFSAKYSVLGYLIHHTMSIFWGTIHAAVHGQGKDAGQPAQALARGAATAAAACFVDYQLTPKRLTPGFEHRLSKPALTGVYIAFGAGLALACIALAKKR